ncbi:unnamed protein product [Parascedosporium putredinis]|uniref:DUF6314 domain-containing protein n=1 Tax=Parascedosporium putredinis TaxID=1442378 RepID=A0A9P1MAU7_9PEZI|nr:unnamed protein product [Parascedosporium putredinis]CAI7997490.1 unnamed protein product [Parascedosporium putredinis]
MPQPICVIGAGPSGLVAAKTIAQRRNAQGEPIFSVTVYDARDAVGGLWPLDPADNARQIHPLMTANLSRHTIQFSDLAWDESDGVPPLGSSSETAAAGDSSQLSEAALKKKLQLKKRTQTRTVPEFPKAWMVGRYLQRYARTYLEGVANVELKLGTRVLGVRRKGEGGGHWVVETAEGADGGRVGEREFEGVVVASGYFGKPKIPEFLRAENGDAEGKEVPVVHSTAYRDLETLLKGPEGQPRDGGRGGKILVVGGQMSGVEVAATIATQLSSAVHSPGESPIRNPEKYSVHHLADRHTWVMPFFTTPTTPPPPTSAAAPYPKPPPASPTSGSSSPRHRPVRRPPLARVHDPSAPAFVALSQLYMPLLRAGLIDLSRGRLARLDGTTARTEDGEEIQDIAAVVLATGFDPSASLEFLEPAVLKAIGHAPDYPELTPALAFHGTHHPSVPGLGFVSFYRGPYWGVAEMQARFLAELWTPEDVSPRSEALARALRDDRSAEELVALRGSDRLTQFPTGDYVYLMHHSSHPSGTFSGTGRFLVRQKTLDGLDSAPARASAAGELEYLYIEEGTFESTLGFSFSATRRYVYRYDEAADILSVWFVCVDDAKKADYLFHEVEFLPQSPDASTPASASAPAPAPGGVPVVRAKGIEAKAGHLCGDDYYSVRYEFGFKAVNLERWTVGYQVKGPKKDYTLHAVYTRE